jgi:uncharacterized protein (TIGR03083 family)
MEDRMPTIDAWPCIHAERRALSEDLAPLDDGRWATTSLCSDWTIRDVLAHLTATAKIGPPQFFAKMIASGFSLGRLQAKDIAVEKGASTGETLTRFAAVTDSSKHPPGPTDAWLGEAIIHAEDIRRPLGIAHDYQTDAVVRVADFYKGSNLIVGTKKRIAGLRLKATDVAWSHGDGPEVTGPVLSLVMAMTGRNAVIDDLSGDGLATLKARP